MIRGDTKQITIKDNNSALARTQAHQQLGIIHKQQAKRNGGVLKKESSRACKKQSNRTGGDGARRDARRDARHPTVVLRKQPLSGGEAREVSRLEASAALCRATLPSSDEATGRSQKTIDFHL